MKPSTLALAVAAPFCWGTGLTLAKPITTHFPPIFLMLLLYAAVAAMSVLTVREKINTSWRALVPISVFSITIQGALLFWGLRGVDATTANLLLQTQVPIAIVLGWLIGGEALNSRKLIGMAISLIGVTIVIGLPEERPAMVPVALIIVSGFFWSLGQVLVRKLSQDTGIVLLKANALYAVPQLILATALFETGQWQSVQSASLTQWANVIFVAVVGSYLAYIAWYSLLRRARMDEAAPFILLMTPIGVVTAVVVLGEQISLAQVIGGAVLLFGLAVVNDLVPRTKIAT